MDVLTSLCAKPARLVIGLMSGTSADGVDAALCRIHGSGTDIRVEQLAFVCQPYPARVPGAAAGAGRGRNGRLPGIVMDGRPAGTPFAVAAGRSAGRRAFPVKRWIWWAATGTPCGISPPRRITWARPSPARCKSGSLPISARPWGARWSAISGCGTWPRGARARPWCPTRNSCSTGTRTPPWAQNLGGIGNLTILPRGGRWGTPTPLTPGRGTW